MAVTIPTFFLIEFIKQKSVVINNLRTVIYQRSSQNEWAFKMPTINAYMRLTKMSNIIKFKDKIPVYSFFSYLEPKKKNE